MGKIKDFSIVLFGTQVYNPGSLVNGYVVLELSASQNCKCISIVLSGKAISGSDSTETLISNTEIRLLGDDRGSQQVASGRYEFRFSFQLPRSLPSSYEGRKGSICYALTAALSRPWSSKRYVVQTVTVKDIVRINTALSSSCWKAHQKTRGPVRMCVKTDRGGYYSGESIALSVNVKNGGNGRIAAVQAVLMQKVVYYGIERNSPGWEWVGQRQTRAPSESLIARHHDMECICLLRGPGAESGGEINWNDRMLIPVDTVPNISNCKVINLSYILVVETMGVKSSSLSVEVPIVIGSKSFREQTIMGSTNANRPPATNSGSRPVQVEQLSTNIYTFQWLGTNQGSMSLERNYPGSRNEFLRDQGELPGTHTFQCSLRNLSSQREHSGMPLPPCTVISQTPTTNARSMTFSHFGSSVPQTPATNPELVSFQREQIVTSNSTNQARNGNLHGACPPLSTGNDQEMRETAFAPMNDSVTNCNSDQPPPYDSLVTGAHSHNSYK